MKNKQNCFQQNEIETTALAFPMRNQVAFCSSDLRCHFGRFRVALTILTCAFLLFAALVDCLSAQIRNSGAQNSSETPPHPAVVRVIAKHGRVSSYGSGTLIAKKPNYYGFVITNWHVVCDSNGYVTVRFPDKREFPAAVIAVDDRWDLALLVIAEPSGVSPVAISPTIPKIGSYYWVAGYRGDGTYRIRGGPCLSFQRPEADSVEPELIDIGVPAEGGDSGGPVFNDKYELSGVLFGSDNVTTVASHCGRVNKFLEQAVPQVAKLPADLTLILQAAAMSQQSILQRGAAALSSANSTTTPSAAPNLVQSSVSSSLSFGGSSIRSRNQTQQSQLAQQTRHHGFLSVQYDPVPTNDALLASRTSGVAPGASTTTTFSVSSQGSQADIASNNAPPTSSASASTTPGHVTAYPAHSANTVPSSPAQPNFGTSALSNGTASNNGVAQSNGTAASNTRAVSNEIAASNGGITTSSNNGATASANGGFSLRSQPNQSQPDQSQFVQTNQPTAVLASASPVVSESIPAAVSRASAPTNAAPLSENQQTTSGSSSQIAAAQPASVTPATSSTATSFPSQSATVSPGYAASPQSSGDPHGQSSFKKKSETTPGGVRSNTNTPASNNRNSSTNGQFGTYSDSSPQSASDYAAETHWADHDETAARYALDSAEMLTDDYAPKYGDDYSAESNDVAGSIASPSKFDAAKIVIAILVIFFILFHTIKTMAIAEEKAAHPGNPR